MSFVEAVRSVFEKAFTVEGRARRSEYWYFVLFEFLLMLAFGIIISIGFDFIKWVQMIVSIALIVPGITVSVRRLHDIGKSGWALLLILIPVIGAFILLYFHVLDSQAGDNQYGPNPKDQDVIDVV